MSLVYYFFWIQCASGLEKQTSAILEFFFSLRFSPDHSNLRSVCVKLPNFVQIGPPAISNDIQDGGHSGSIQLMASYLLTSLSSENQNLLADQISSTADHQRRRYDVLPIFKMAAAAAHYCFRFRI